MPHLTPNTSFGTEVNLWRVFPGYFFFFNTPTKRKKAWRNMSHIKEDSSPRSDLWPTNYPPLRPWSLVVFACPSNQCGVSHTVKLPPSFLRWHEKKKTEKKWKTCFHTGSKIWSSAQWISLPQKQLKPIVAVFYLFIYFLPKQSSLIRNSFSHQLKLRQSLWVPTWVCPVLLLVRTDEGGGPSSIQPKSNTSLNCRRCFL